MGAVKPSGPRKLLPAELAESVPLHDRFVVDAGQGRRAVPAQCDLSEVELSHRNLSNGDFTATKFTRAVLKRTRFSKAVLFVADFSLANLIGADLAGADLRGVSFRGAILDKAVLAGADLREAAVMRYNGSDVTAETRKTDFSAAHA